MAAMNEVADLLPDTVLLDYIRAQIPSNDKLWTFRKHLAVQYACQVCVQCRLCVWPDTCARSACVLRPSGVRCSLLCIATVWCLLQSLVYCDRMVSVAVSCVLRPYGVCCSLLCIATVECPVSLAIFVARPERAQGLRV